MTAPALRTIAAELLELANAADDQHPVDPFAVRVLARKIGAQAEMIEQGISG